MANFNLIPFSLQHICLSVACFFLFYKMSTIQAWRLDNWRQLFAVCDNMGVKHKFNCYVDAQVLTNVHGDNGLRWITFKISVTFKHSNFKKNQFSKFFKCVLSLRILLGRSLRRLFKNRAHRNNELAIMSHCSLTIAKTNTISCKHLFMMFRIYNWHPLEEVRRSGYTDCNKSCYASLIFFKCFGNWKKWNRAHEHHHFQLVEVNQ